MTMKRRIQGLTMVLRYRNVYAVTIKCIAIKLNSTRIALYKHRFIKCALLVMCDCMYISNKNVAGNTPAP